MSCSERIYLTFIGNVSKTSQEQALQMLMAAVMEWNSGPNRKSQKTVSLRFDPIKLPGLHSGVDMVGVSLLLSEKKKPFEYTCLTERGLLHWLDSFDVHSIIELSKKYS
jgi:hypothetical protein